MSSVKILKENFVDIPRLRLESEILMNDYSQGNEQLCLTSVSGNDDWFSGAGKNTEAEQFNVINKSIQGSYINQLLDLFPNYCRWRLMLLNTKTAYSIHYDGRENTRNFRIHIPVTSNLMSLMMFFDHSIATNDVGNARYYRMKEGNIYLFYASRLHTAMNCSMSEKRLHIVGERNVTRR